MSAIKIALVQKKAIPNDKERNLSLAVQYIREASYLGADIVLFPEMWSNGYAPPFDGAFDNPTDPAFEKERNEWLESAVLIESDYVTAVKDAASTYKIGVCATFLSKTKDKFQNTAIIIDRRGNILLNYAKVHTCDFSIVKADDMSEDILIAEFDMNRIRTYRERETWGNSYRKPAAYSDLVSFEVKKPFIRNK